MPSHSLYAAQWELDSTFVAPACRQDAGATKNAIKSAAYLPLIYTQAMITRPLKDVAAWVEYFDHADIPVLTRTQTELVRFKNNEDNLNGRELADAIMHDPLMTLKLRRMPEAAKMAGGLR